MKTAVEWFALKLYEKFEMKGDGKVFDELLETALEMEKEQIEKSHIDGGKNKRTAVKYYNETFKSE